MDTINKNKWVIIKALQYGQNNNHSYTSYFDLFSIKVKKTVIGIKG